MDHLSYELIEHVASFADAAAVQALSMTCRTMRLACRRRLDPVVYLQATFRHPRTLLAAMADHGCVLSGSRALEFLVPGSCVPHSDWDFLVPCSRDATLGMMAALEAAGVIWPNPLQPLLGLAGEPLGTVAHVPVLALRQFTAESLTNDLMVRCKPEEMRLLAAVYRYLPVHDDDDDVFAIFNQIQGPNAEPANPNANPSLLHDLSAWLSVHVAPDGVPRVAPITLRDALDERETNAFRARTVDYDNEAEYAEWAMMGGGWPLRLVNGTAPDGNKVQLFQCHAESAGSCDPLTYVMETYHASHVQCFVAGWGVFHPLYRLARERFALLWPGGRHDVLLRSVTANRMRAVAKYRARGYRFFNAGSLVEIGDDLAPLANGPALTASQTDTLLSTARALLTANADAYDITAAPSSRGETASEVVQNLSRDILEAPPTPFPHASETFGPFHLPFSTLEGQLVAASPSFADAALVRHLYRDLRQAHVHATMRFTRIGRLSTGLAKLPSRPRGWITASDAATRQASGLLPLEVLAQAQGERLSPEARERKARGHLGVLRATQTACTTCGKWSEHDLAL